MKKNNKSRKGFTIVELVIVIAVIAILAAVLIPTFSGVIEKANMSAVEQRASALFKEAYALDLADGTLDGKDGTTQIETVSEVPVTYTVTTAGDADTMTFSYTDSTKGYIATYSGETSSWSVAEVTNNN